MSKSFDVTSAAVTLRNRHLEENKKLETRRAEAQVFGKKVAELMGRADDSLDKVIGFGSTYETWRDYRADSDIDIGLAGGDVRLLEKVLPNSDFKVSLIELSDQSESFREMVLKNGIVLYEK